MSFRKAPLALSIFLAAQLLASADAADSATIEPEEFSKMVAEKRYQQAHSAAVEETKLVPEELEYVRGNKLVPYDKRHIYLRRPFEYYEVLLATKEDKLAQRLEAEIFKTMPERACVDRMIQISVRANNMEASKRLESLKNQCKQ